MSLYDRIFKPRRYTLPSGAVVEEKRSRAPLILLVLSSVGNVILDMVFVAGLHWGVAGVAWATFIAQGASGVLAFVLLLRRVRSFDTLSLIHI